MAKRKSIEPIFAANKVIVSRAARLYRLIDMLGKEPQTRAVLLKRLKQNVRGFYRDLEYLAKIGVYIVLVDNKYKLEGAARNALAKIPFPDPGLTLGEALQLAKGRTKAHQKLKDQIKVIENP